MITDIETIARLFNKSVEYTANCMLKYDVEALPTFRLPNDGLEGFYSEMTAILIEEPSLTKQEFAVDCDPNVILDRVQRGQDISLYLNNNKPVYGDFTNVPSDYHSALNVVTKANQAFNQLDAHIRAQFDNDPAQFVEYVNNPKNADALIQLGLAVPRQETPSVSAPAAPAGESGGGEGA